jgi:hypothetical protein
MSLYLQRIGETEHMNMSRSLPSSLLYSYINTESIIPRIPTPADRVQSPVKSYGFAADKVALSMFSVSTSVSSCQFSIHELLQIY